MECDDIPPRLRALLWGAVALVLGVVLWSGSAPAPQPPPCGALMGGWHPDVSKEMAKRCLK